MIQIVRTAEPEELTAVRAQELARVRALLVFESLTSKLLGKEYGVAKRPLFLCQGKKCCYCEKPVEDRYEDLEHYRPKVAYWWLAWSWENLLYACPQCNRPGKRAAFPLVANADRLVPEQPPPGEEQPLLLDPTRDHPVEHVQFHRSKVEGREVWRAHARGGSVRGLRTIELIGLNRESLVEFYGGHVNNLVRPAVDRLQTAMDSGDLKTAQQALTAATRRLLRRASPFAALSFDALCELIPAATLQSLHAQIPVPPID